MIFFFFFNEKRRSRILDLCPNANGLQMGGLNHTHFPAPRYGSNSGEGTPGHLKDLGLDTCKSSPNYLTDPIFGCGPNWTSRQIQTPTVDLHPARLYLGHNRIIWAWPSGDQTIRGPLILPSCHQNMTFLPAVGVGASSHPLNKFHKKKR